MELEQTLPKLFRKSAEKYPEFSAQLFRTKDGTYAETNYHDCYQKALDFSGALLKFGVKRGDKIGLIADNRREWEQADMGLLAIGAIDTPRGCDASEKDLSYILSFSEVEYVIAENEAQVKKIINIRPKVPTLRAVVSFDEIDSSVEKQLADANLRYHLFEDLQKLGHEWRKENPDVVEQELEKGQWDDLATIIFTSGTTGTPKGVMLSHGNILTQLDEVTERIFLNPGERALCVLPVWHAFQRAVEYVILSQGGTLCYSKPIGSVLLQDLQKLDPYLLPAVPRVWEAVYDGIWRKMRKTGGLVYIMFRFFVAEAMLWCSIDRKLRRKNSRFGRDYLGFWWPVLVLPWLLLYPIKMLGNLLVFRKIRAMLGKNFRSGIAGGGAYPENIDKFFWAVGVKVCEGYGLTETAPIISVRPIVDPVMRNVGTPLRGMQVRVVDDDGIILGRCKKGNLQIKGGCVMQGYYKRPDLTDKVMTVDGWFDTGDIAILTVDGEIQLRGRKKDTIVLLGGENIEPLPIESKIKESRFVASAVVFGTNEKGEDQRYLTAIILPNQDELVSYAEENGIQADTYEKLVETEAIQKLIENEVAEAVNSKNGFKAYERINKIALITKPFEVGVEMSAKQEIMRYRIAEIYKDKIAKMYAD
ncbi:AMP-dependent synthetase/ligase [Treponema peruense]|uniref:Long-chain fatty acid--CoA ligase n=1 Tax=Treponema peruense TaxID=2787628 RepID=A0A7T3RCV1_9SPIR|nr:long-chain fatty acid--CoA ligase [Treponema peruense]QQA00772.1 long-chain fatty acid--CoA ligase [Treponema peruense]